MARLASRIGQLEGEGALAVFARARELERAGRSVIHLELGEPDFHPSAPVLEAAKRALDAGRDRYCPPAGLPELREAVAEYLRRTRGLATHAENVLASEFIQWAAIEALRDPAGAVPAMVAEFRRRRELLTSGLNAVPGFACLPPAGAFYAWADISATGLTERAMAELMLEEAGVAAIPGTAFGAGGAGFLRFSFAANAALLEEAASRILQLSSRWTTAPAVPPGL